MKYRRFGKTGVDVSVLGFGAMRLPMNGNSVDEEEAIAMIRHGIDNGINYVDTAYPYHGGESERIVGEALQQGYREKTYLATKAPIWMYKSADDFDKTLEQQLKKLQTDYIDFYLLHSLTSLSWDNLVLKLDLLDKMQQAKDKGLIKHMGFSFHDKYPLYDKILNCGFDWDFCQIQLNYLDTQFQAGIQGMHDAAKKDLGIIIMEPVRGGYLADVPQGIKDIFATAKTKRSPVAWSLDYLWNMPENHVLLSGMSSMAQLKENLLLADKAEAKSFTKDDENIIAKATDTFAKYRAIPCTGCDYCKPCPQNVGIQETFNTYNKYNIDKDIKKAKTQYNVLKQFGINAAESCNSCRACEKLCPQQIEVSKWMTEINQVISQS